MKRNFGSVAAAATGIVLSALPAAAHVGLSVEEAHKGATFTLGFGIGHGCEGNPTTTVRLQVPEGVISVQPYAKPGWEIEVVSGAYGATQMRGEIPVSEGVVQINWTGGSLDNALYDEFVIRARIADNIADETMIWFPVVQECAAGGVHRWIAIPVEGQAEPDEPAPGLLVLPAEPGGRGH
jgi:uncharacterized protein YcnI